MQKNNIFNQTKGATREPQRFAIQESRLSRIIRNCAVLLVLAMMLPIILPSIVMAFPGDGTAQEKAKVSMRTVFVDLYNVSVPIPGATTKLVSTDPNKKEEYSFTMSDDGSVLSQELPLGTYKCVVSLPADSKVLAGKNYTVDENKIVEIKDANTDYNLTFEVKEEPKTIDPEPGNGQGQQEAFIRMIFKKGDHGILQVGAGKDPSSKVYDVRVGITLKDARRESPSFIPTVIPDQGYIHRGWKVIAKGSDLDGRQVYPNLDGLDDYVFTENLTLEAIYSEVNTVSDSPVNPIYLDWDQIKDLVSEPTVEVKVTPATPSLTPERKALPVTGESRTGSYVAGLSLLSLGLILLVIRRANRP